MRLLFRLVPMTMILAAYGAEDIFPTNSLRIMAVIDGTDELHISHKSARWLHKSWQFPTEVEINGRKWNPQEKAVWTANPAGGLLQKDLNLCGAVLHKLRGRGTVTLSRDSEGLVMVFDDPEGGSDTYEASLDFAEVISKEPANSPAETDVRLRFQGMIDGLDEVWFSGQNALLMHVGWSLPTRVTLNGRAWDIEKTNTFRLSTELLPELLDLQRTRFQKIRARGVVTCEYQSGQLCLDLEDHHQGADLYDVLITIPRFGKRHLVQIGGVADLMMGASLKIYRVSETIENRALLAGQRVFDANGHCEVALESGQYQFEVLHNAGTNAVVALKTAALNIGGPTNIDLNAIRIEPIFIGPVDQPLAFDELSLRSSRRSGDVVWKANPNASASAPVLILSEGQTYNLHAFAHTGHTYAAVWKTASANEIRQISLPRDRWLECSFHWREATPVAAGKAIEIQFPDGSLEISNADASRFFTNRRFFGLGYSLDFGGKRRAVFEPRGEILSAQKGRDFMLGGPLRPLASAAIMQDENLGKPEDLRLWWEITLADSQDYLLDTTSSTIDWKPLIKLTDGSPAPPAPLTSEAVKSLATLSNTLIATATFTLDRPMTVSAPPETFVPRQYKRFDTEVPSYRKWNTMAYLSKAERELNLIFSVRHETNDPKHKLHIKWWLNHGAVGGGDSVRMPFDGYLKTLNWYSHPWSIAHEMLHTFGVGHTHEMDRLDRAVQEYMDYQHWYAADHPEYVPE